jgi:quinol monooxygenase YgiN
MLVVLTIKPERRDEFVAALREVLPLARAEAACLMLLAAEAAGEPEKFVLLESWRDRDEYRGEILGRDYFRRYLAVSEAAYAAPRQVTLLDEV